MICVSQGKYDSQNHMIPTHIPFHCFAFHMKISPCLLPLLPTPHPLLLCFSLKINNLHCGLYWGSSVSLTILVFMSDMDCVWLECLPRSTAVGGLVPWMMAMRSDVAPLKIGPCGMSIVIETMLWKGSSHMIPWVLIRGLWEKEQAWHLPFSAPGSRYHHLFASKMLLPLLSKPWSDTAKGQPLPWSLYGAIWILNLQNCVQNKPLILHK